MAERQGQVGGAGEETVSRWIFAIPVVAFAIIGFFLFRGLYLTPTSVYLPSVLIDKPAPEVDLAPLDAATPGFTRADLAAGHVTVVNFFASWCVPCHEEADTLLRFSKTPGIIIYGVDYEDERLKKDGQDGRAFLSDVGNPFSKIVADIHGRTAIDWGVYGAPETFVVDGKGVIRFKVVGALTDEIIAKQLMPEIEKAKQGS